MTENRVTSKEWLNSAEANDYLPEPTGFRMLVKPIEIEQKSKGGIVLVDESRQYTEMACQVGEVIKKGLDCYRDKTSVWCKEGDYVLYAKHVGQKIEVKEDNGSITKYLLINDDDVRATVKDPARIRMYL